MGRPVLPELISRPVPLMMPLVSVWSRPKGFPMANTFCPTSSPAESPSFVGCSSGCRKACTTTQACVMLSNHFQLGLNPVSAPMHELLSSGAAN